MEASADDAAMYLGDELNQLIGMAGEGGSGLHSGDAAAKAQIRQQTSGGDAGQENTNPR